MTKVQACEFQASSPQLLLLLGNNPILFLSSLFKMPNLKVKSGDLLSQGGNLPELRRLPELDRLKLGPHFPHGLLLIVLGYAVAIKEAIDPFELHADHYVSHHEFLLVVRGEGVAGDGFGLNVLLAAQPVAARH